MEGSPTDDLDFDPVTRSFSLMDASEAGLYLSVKIISDTHFGQHLPRQVYSCILLVHEVLWACLKMVGWGTDPRVAFPSSAACP